MDTQQKNRNEEKNDELNDSEIPNNWGSLAYDVESKEPHFEEHQTEIFRIHPKRPLQSLIAGYDSLKMVMYVSRVDFIVELFDELGIVGGRPNRCDASRNGAHATYHCFH